jgi:hypothetical protein
MSSDTFNFIKISIFRTFVFYYEFYSKNQMDLTANSVETCQYPEFNKDDITLLPQLGFGLMFLYSLGLVIKTGKNISVLLSLKHQLNIQKLMRLNCLVLLMLISKNFKICLTIKSISFILEME